MLEEKDNEQEWEEESLDNVDVVGPFDPSQIDVDIATFNMGSVIDMLANDEIDLNPDFQRNSNIWSEIEKSRLIESILLGLPLPSFYFNEDSNTGKLSVIDGLQRLCSIYDFVLNKEHPLVLQGLQFLEQYNNLTYDKLDRPSIRRINGHKITINTLRKNTPSDVKYVIFRRVNTAGKPLNSQELRHSMNPGPVLKLIKDMANMPSFKDVMENKLPSRRMVDRDFVTRYLAFMYYTNWQSNDLDYFLNLTMQKLNKESDEVLERIKCDFDRAMRTCKSVLGDDRFRKPRDRGKRMPINKSLWDSISVNIAKLSENQQYSLVERKDDFQNKLRNLFSDSLFLDSITRGTEKVAQSRTRFSCVEQIIKETLGND